MRIMHGLVVAVWTLIVAVLIPATLLWFFVFFTRHWESHPGSLHYETREVVLWTLDGGKCYAKLPHKWK